MRASNHSRESLPERELQALRQVGRTAISRLTAVALAGLFLVTLVAVPALRFRSAEESRPLAPFGELARRSSETVGGASGWRLTAANRRLIGRLRAFEDGLEESSWPRRRLLPPLQLLLTGLLGAGNEQAYPGDDGWLYYRPDVDHLTGPGFLESDQLARRARSGEAWEEPPQPDPVIALVDFANQIEAAGARLVVLPTPVKPAIRPGFLSRAAAGHAGLTTAPLRNPSWQEFVRRLEAAGLVVVDPAPELTGLEGERYLATDTHWRPEAVELTAALLARVVEPLLGPPPGAPSRVTRYSRRPVVVENVGDITAMLRLPAAQRLFAAERLAPRMVLDSLGRPWRRDPASEVLLLGDSFTNVYSDPALGWGRGAGLAEQLSYELARPVDKIALNAGGAHATREALARALAADRTRLAGKRVVVYQFANRELSMGDWRLVPLAR